MSNKILASSMQNNHWRQLQNHQPQLLNVAAISAVFPGTLQASAIEHYLQQLTAGFEILRTGFEADDLGALWQVVFDEVALDFTVLDWSELDHNAFEEAKTAISNQTPQTQAHWFTPWHKVVLAHRGDTSWLYLEMNSLNSDAFSLNYLLNALIDAGSGQLADSPDRLHEEVIQYSDLTPWLADFLVDEEMADARAYWTREQSLAAHHSVFSLQRYTQPSKSATPSATNGYGCASVTLGDDFAAISAYATTHGATVAEVVCASLRMSLSRFSPKGQLSRVFDCRADESLADAFGPLSRAVPLFPTKPHESLDSFEAAVKAEIECSALGLDYAECFAKGNEVNGFSFIFDAMNGSDNVSGSAVEQLICLPEACKMQFMLLNQGTDTRLQISYDNDYITTSALNDFLDCAKADLITGLTGLSGIAGADKSKLLAYSANGEKVSADGDITVLDQFERIQATVGGMVTLVEGDSATFGQINENANRLAHHLLELGIGKGDAVALCLARSVEFVTAMLAVMKSGAAYVPVDIELPAQRISSMLQDARAKALICHGAFEVDGCQSIDCTAVALDHYQPTAPQVSISGDDLAYILFTSGSTGKAKGVSIGHSALLNHMNWINREFSFTAKDHFLQRTSASFDASIWEFWSPLLVGATMVIAPSEINYDLAMFSRILSEQQISQMQIVPSLLDILVDQFADGAQHKQQHALKNVFCGGEALRTSTAAKAQQALGCDIVNLYGPSECCVDAIFWRYDHTLTLLTDFVPIGFPVDNLTCRVIKADGTAAAKGESGELEIAGASLFSGYHEQPQLTAAALSRCDATQTTYYQTGDNVAILADGNLMFMERLDDQVKLNGFRIEPEEIAMVVLNADLASEAKCIYSELSNSLSLFYIGAKVAEAQILKRLVESLPKYMIPDQLIEIETLPYLSNGKLNKRALVEQAASHSSGGYVAPTNAIEATLVEMWQELLETSMNIGINHDFFTIGGHSILAMKVLSRIGEQFDVAISVRILFEHRTIAELAAYIEPLTLLGNEAGGDDDEDDMEGGLL
jgi:amino acid adenylation domain-containing protein